MFQYLIAGFLFFSVGCGLTSARKEPTQKPPAKTVVTDSMPSGANVEVKAAPLEAASNKVEVIPPKPEVAPAHHREKGPVEADAALELLKAGNQRFRKGFLRKEGFAAKDRKRLTEGQKPHAIVFSCSDSRVPPELVFDQKLGEIFVVRTAGQSADYSAIASIEYAIAHLGANLIVVMGHESCGAVKAAHGAFAGGEADSPYLASLIKEIQPRINLFASTKLSQGALDESWANVIGATKDLLNKSALVRHAVESGEVKIARSLYHLGSGQVEWK